MQLHRFSIPIIPIIPGAGVCSGHADRLLELEALLSISSASVPHGRRVERVSSAWRVHRHEAHENFIFLAIDITIVGHWC